MLASQLRARRDEGIDSAESRKRAEEMAKRTGKCMSVCGCRCEAYEPGGKDAFGWQLCQCSHTQHAHSKVS